MPALKRLTHNFNRRALRPPLRQPRCSAGLARFGPEALVSARQPYAASVAPAVPPGPPGTPYAFSVAWRPAGARGYGASGAHAALESRRNYGSHRAKRRRSRHAGSYSPRTVIFPALFP